MNFNEHWNLEGKHAFLSPSSPHWLRYDRDKLLTVYRNMMAKERGTKLHAFAADAIKYGVKLSHSRRTLNKYVNDAIGFGLQPEKILYYSDRCFGTADAIEFHDGLLRIHDLKTGKHPAHFEQLEVYAALFCLEYGVDPNQIDIVLRLYQNDEVFENIPEGELISDRINTIVESDAVLASEDNKEEV